MTTIKIDANITLDSSPEIVGKIITENTFKNPVFESNELNHRSNWNTPRTIETYSDTNGQLLIPRGYMRDLLNILKDHDITPVIDDQRVSVSCAYPDKLDGITLRDYQDRAVESAMRFDQGVIVSPTGSGKTLIALEVLRRKKQKALVLVSKKDLAAQWIKVIKDRLGLTAGLIGGGQWEIGSEITIGLVQTLASREKETKALSEAFGLIIAEEVHRCPSRTYFDVLSLLKAKYRYGLSATLDRRDGLMPIIFRGIGPVITTIEKSEVEEVGSIVPAVIHAIETGFSPRDANSWADYLSEIAGSAERNQIIIDLAKNAQGSVLILCDRVAHAEQLSGMLTRKEIDHTLVHGELRQAERFDAMSRIKTADITIGTSGLLSEGIDVASWEILIMASPISSEIKLLQSIGRVVRSSGDLKQKAIVYDLRDDCGFAGASFKNRLGIYQKHNIKVNFGIRPTFQNDPNAPWRNLKPTEKQISFLSSTGCKNIDLMTRGQAADLISSGRVRRAG